MADQERICDKCGRTFKSDGAWYAKHALSCKGVPAKSGRVAQPAARKTKSKRADVRPEHRRAAPRVKASPYAGAIAELEGQRGRLLTEADRCTKAIELLEAMG